MFGGVVYKVGLGVIVFPWLLRLSKDANNTAGKILSTVSFLDLLMNPKFTNVDIKPDVNKVTAFTALLGLSLSDLAKTLQSKIQQASQDPSRIEAVVAKPADDKKTDKKSAKDKKNPKDAKENKDSTASADAKSKPSKRQKKS